MGFATLFFFFASLQQDATVHTKSGLIGGEGLMVLSRCHTFLSGKKTHFPFFLFTFIFNSFY